jgi:biotin transport system substrate-specific component
MSTYTETRGPLAGALVPNMTLAKDLGLILGGAALTAIGAQIQVPWQPVPLTMQTLAVALCGLALGARRGALSQVAYLGAGIAGMPIFAEGKFGPATLLGPTGGYLVAFVAVAWLLGVWADRGWDRKPLKLAGGMLLANVVLFGFGALWLSSLIGIEKALTAGVLPFVGSELVKDVIAVLALPSAWWLVGKKR